MSNAKIINHWEGAGCDGHCSLCLYGESKDCITEIKKDTKALVKNFKELSIERDQLVGIKVRLLDDIEEQNERLEKRVEEVFPDFMEDYQAMKEELEGLHEELKRTKEALSLYEAPVLPNVEAVLL